MFKIFGSAADVRTKINSELLLTALDYWESIAANDTLPKRSSIDPMAVPKLLPTTFIVVAEEDGEFRYQLAGSLIEEKYQLGTLKDKTPQEVAGHASENVLGPYRRVRDEAVLFYRESTLQWVSDAQKYNHYMVLLMPMSDDGESVNMIYGVQDFIKKPQLMC